jgi:hypothetical protein
MSPSNSVLTGEEALALNSRVSYIAPLPYSCNIGIGPGNELEPRLSVLSRMSIDSAVKAWEKHPDSKIVISGETDYDGLPNTTDLMAEHAQQISEIVEESIVRLNTLPDGQPLNNTYLQVESLLNYLGGADGRVLGIPLGFHLPRVMQIAGAYGFDADFVTAEAVHDAAGVSEYEVYLPHIAGLERSERMKVFVGRLDNKGRLGNLLQRITGPNLVDVVETEEGYRLEQGFTRSKQKALQRRLDTAKTVTAH